VGPQLSDYMHTRDRCLDCSVPAHCPHTLADAYSLPSHMHRHVKAVQHLFNDDGKYSIYLIVSGFLVPSLQQHSISTSHPTFRKFDAGPSSFLGKFHQVDWYSVTLLGPRSPRRMDVGNERAFESITCIVELGDLA